MVRNLEQIIERLKDGLKLSNSKLADFRTGSNIYSLFRSIASVISEQYVDILSYKNSIYIETASGQELDKKGMDYGINRKLGSYSRGYVLVSGMTSSIKEGTILTDIETKVQFEILNSIAREVEEVAVEVKSLNISTAANLEAGKLLYSTVFPSTKFIVGSYRNPITQVISGGIEGGEGIETDSEYRQRIKNHILSYSKTSISSLISRVLQVKEVTKVYLQEQTPVAGYIKIYVDSTEERVLRNVELVANTYKAAGICVLVKSLTPVKIAININVVVRGEKSLIELETEIKRSIYSYVAKLKLGEGLEREKIASVLYRIDDIRNVNIITPSLNIPTLLSEYIVISTLKVNIEKV